MTPSDLLENQIENYSLSSLEKIDQIWVIDNLQKDKTILSVNEINSILEKNVDLFVSKGEIDEKLLYNFIVSHIGDIKIIDNPNDVAEILAKWKICCEITFKPLRIKITITYQ
jgi:hypothetical protein